jgi:Leucine Rich repeats (2 copies)
MNSIVPFGSNIQPPEKKKEKYTDSLFRILPEIKNRVMRESDLFGVLKLSQLNKKWNKWINKNHDLWELLMMNLRLPLLKEETIESQKARIKERVELINHQTKNIFKGVILKPVLVEKLNELLKIPSVENNYKLEKLCKAVGTLLVWDKLQAFFKDFIENNGIGGLIDLNLNNFNSLDELIKMADQFEHWSEENHPQKDILEFKSMNFDLSNLQLTSLPEGLELWFDHCPNLNELYLHNNQLTAVPSLICSKHFCSIFLENNQITSFPEEFIEPLANKSVFVLDLGKNQLSSVPNGIGKLKELVCLTLSNNLIASLPAELGLLSELYKLDLRNNQLTSVPPELKLMKNLDILDLEGNPLDSKKFKS